MGTPMRNDDPLGKQLRSWGFAKVNRYATVHDPESAPDVHPISRARQFAPMTREKAALTLVGRASERRRLMAKPLEECGVTIIPAEFVDPIRCVESRIDGPIPRPHEAKPVAAVDWGVPDDLQWIDRAVAQLSRVSRICALCLQAEFCEVGTQDRKAAIVQARYGGKLSVWQYRRELRRALDWLRMSPASRGIDKLHTQS